MDEKIRELIAIGAAVTANCVPCVKFHVQKAQGAGASDQEIVEAINVGRTVRSGAANIWDDEVSRALGLKLSAEEQA